MIPVTEAPEWADGLFPEKPLMFKIIPGPFLAYGHIHSSLRVICSARVEADGKRWMHVSASRPSRLPSWEDMRLVKDTFIGRERKAIQIMPPENEYVNLHQHVLHLWSCLDGDPLPDFRVMGSI
jgi:hypothetical protein